MGLEMGVNSAQFLKSFAAAMVGNGGSLKGICLRLPVAVLSWQSASPMLPGAGARGLAAAQPLHSLACAAHKTLMCVLLSM